MGKFLIFTMEKLSSFFIGLLLISSVSEIETVSLLKKSIEGNKILLIIILLLLIFKNVIFSIKNDRELLSEIMGIAKVYLNEIMIGCILLFHNWYFSFFIVLALIVLMYFYPNLEKKKKNIELYPSRKKAFNKLKSYLEDKTIKSIVIDGEWGLGKTTFVEYLLQEVEDILPIKVKTSMFKDKAEIRMFVFKEVRKILCANGILTDSIDEIIEVFNKLLNQNRGVFQKSKSTFYEVHYNLREEIKKLRKKKIVIILDDLERIDGQEKIKEIINLISDLEDFFNLKVITLLNYSCLSKEHTYFEKYMDVKVKLNEVPGDEILSLEIKDKKLKKIIFNSIDRFELKEELLLSGEMAKESEDKFDQLYDSKRLEIHNKTKNPRFIKRFIKEYKSISFEKIQDRNLDIYNEKSWCEFIFGYFVIRDTWLEKYEEYIMRYNAIPFREKDNLEEDEWDEFIFEKCLRHVIQENVARNKRLTIYECYNTINQLEKSEELYTLKYLKETEVKEILANYEKSYSLEEKLDLDKILDEAKKIYEVRDVLGNSVKKKYFVTLANVVADEYLKSKIGVLRFLEIMGSYKLYSFLEIEEIQKIRRKERNYGEKRYDDFEGEDEGIALSFPALHEYVLDKEHEISFYDLIYPQGTYAVKTFMFLERFNKFVIKKSCKTTEEGFNYFLEYMDSKVKDMEILEEEWEKVRLWYVFLLEASKEYDKIEENKEALEYKEINEVNSEERLVYFCKKGMYSLEEINERKQYIEKEFSPMVYLRCHQILQKNEDGKEAV